MCRLPGIVVVAHFVCIKLITTRHAMLTMRGTKTERERARKRGERGVCQQVTQKCQNFDKLQQLLNAESGGESKAWLRLCATRRIRNIVINLISACNARQAHTVRVCVCVSVCACVCLSDKSRQRRQKQLQLKPTFARILADFVQSAELALKLWQRAVKAPVAPVGGVARARWVGGIYLPSKWQ